MAKYPTCPTFGRLLRRLCGKAIDEFNVYGLKPDCPSYLRRCRLNPLVFWNIGAVWLNDLSYSLIALTYLLIPVALIRIVRKRKDIPFDGVFSFFAAFIVACVVSHVTEVVAFHLPFYWVSGSLKACSAAISTLTLVVLMRLTTKMVSIPQKLADHRFQELIENAPDAILQVDATGAITIANQATERIFGYSRKELIGSNVDLLIPAANRATHRQNRESFHKAGVTRPMGAGMGDLHARRKDGTEITVEIALTPSKTGAGVSTTAVIRDVSHRKRMEQQLEAERADRTQRIEILARLSSGLAHEIKNPLAIIHARANDLAEMAEDGDVSRKQIEKTCASIVETSDRAIQILRGVAAMARVGTHDPMQATSVVAIADQVVGLMQGRYATCNIRLDVVLAPDLPLVECREVQISQVLVNLLNNAFDAVDGDSRSERWVRLAVSTQPASRHDNGIQRLQFDVVDGGPGVAAENRDRLMQTFFTTKALGAGIGVGLSVSRTIAEDHGGQLELRDSNGHTCFRLTLPVHMEEKEEVTI